VLKKYNVIYSTDIFFDNYKLLNLRRRRCRNLITEIINFSLRCGLLGLNAHYNFLDVAIFDQVFMFVSAMAFFFCAAGVLFNFLWLGTLFFAEAPNYCMNERRRFLTGRMSLLASIVWTDSIAFVLSLGALLYNPDMELNRLNIGVVVGMGIPLFFSLWRFIVWNRYLSLEQYACEDGFTLIELDQVLADRDGACCCCI